MRKHKNTKYFWHLLVHLQRIQATEYQQGYAMLVTSILAILVFSMVSVYLFSANLYKSVASSITDANTTFYAAEYALNKRAHKVRLKFDDYSSPRGTAPGVAGNTPAQRMDACLKSGVSSGTETSNDFECRLMQSDFKESTIGNGQGSANAIADRMVAYNNIQYKTYTFVQDITQYSAGNQVAMTRVPVGDDYAGLYNLEYSYRVYAAAVKQKDLGMRGSIDESNVLSSQALLQMDFNNRLIPLFQFAIFYNNDLEIANGPNLTITGPVHTNGRLFLSPDGSTLTFNGDVTSVSDMYKSLEFATRKVGTIASDIGTSFNGASTVNVLMTKAEIDGSKRLKPKQKPLNLPPTGFLTRSGEYYEDADMQVDFDPLNTTDEPIKIKAFGTVLSSEITRSLRQPVLVRPVNRGTGTAPDPVDRLLPETTRLCPRLDQTNKTEPTTIAEAIPAITNPTVNALKNTASGRDAVLALQRAIAQLPNAQSSDIPFSDTTKTAANVSANLNTLFSTELGSHPAITDLLATPLNQIAALDNACFAPPPMQILGKRNRREKRDISVLQTSIKSIAIWNREGRFWSAGVLKSGLNKLFPTKPALSTIPTATSPLKATNPCAFECMGLESSDETQGGLVWHYSVDRTKSVYAYTSGNGTVRGGESPFAFAFTEGRRLPGKLTLATDQAAYIQGDLNNPSNGLGDMAAELDDSFEPTNPASPSREKRPSAVLADTIAVLSNACLDSNYRLSCTRDNSDTNKDAAKDAAANTVIRAGFMARTDKAISSSEASGQLENYITFLENWGGKTFKYRGSILSVGIPTEFSGKWNNNNYYDPPTRNWGFDQDFASAQGLPPMTPRASYLKQKVFRRDYNVQGIN
jgi:hypothetical protein